MNRECSKEGGGSSLYCRYHPAVRLYAEAEEYISLTSWMSTLVHTMTYRCTAGLIQRYDEAEAEVYNALITLIRDTTVLREYAAAALFIMQV